MGYYVRLTEAHFAIPEREDVLQALKDLNHRTDVKKYGGSWGAGGQTEAWFSWMPGNYDETVTSVQEVFDLLGFETEVKDGLVYLTDYDNKTGQEDLFIETVAPFVNEGSYLVWCGEDNAMYRHEIRDGQLVTLVPQEQSIVWV